MILLQILQTLCVITSISNQDSSSRTPCVNKYQHNNLSKISKINQTLPFATFDNFNHFKFTYGHLLNTQVFKELSDPISTILNQSKGYYVIYLGNQNKPQLLFDFFDIPDTNRRLFGLDNDGPSMFEIPKIMQDGSLGSNNLHLWINRRLYFITFYLDHKITKESSSYRLSSEVSFFSTFEVNKPGIFNKFTLENDKFQLLTEKGMYSPQLFLIKFLVQELTAQRLLPTNIKTEVFTNLNDGLSKRCLYCILPVKQVDFSVKKIEAYKVHSNHTKGQQCIKNHFSEIEIKDSDIMINTLIVFRMKLDDGIDDDVKKLEFVVDFCVIYNQFNDIKHLDGNGEVRVNYKGETIGVYDVTNLSKESTNSLKEYSELLNK
eukprot:GAHX01002625.1.p1 GENE.GAHX01002625.1~~GAHX01002625.1.p1  ORF type:complete len:376 (-),score=68.71 GAHX01002625.1:28-1155(-)